MPLCLAFEAGGTHTRGLLVDENDRMLAHCDAGPANPSADGTAEAVRNLTGAAKTLIRQGEGRMPGIVAIAAAGLRAPEQRCAFARAVAHAIGAPLTLVSDDIYPVLMGNAADQNVLLVVAGTGSRVLGRTIDGRMATAGGRGHIAGDAGSAYWLTTEAWRAAARAIDGAGPQTGLIGALRDAMGASDFEEAAVRASQLNKAALARLAPVVTRLAEAGDEVAYACVQRQAGELAALLHAAWRQLDCPAHPLVLMHGGVLRTAECVRNALVEAFRRHCAMFEPRLAALEGPTAIVAWARQWSGGLVADTDAPVATVQQSGTEWREPFDIPPTELQDDSLPPLDCMPAIEIVEAMSRSGDEACAAVREAAPALARAIGRVSDALRANGRLVYLGAGTSGRLGVLDASECPPTFGVAPDRVIGLIAGGERALRYSVEGAEDDETLAVHDLADLEPPISKADAVVGITASGTTPYVRAGLAHARDTGAYPILICCNPHARIEGVDTIALKTGPETLPGSTRLKAGTATKIALNMLTTGAFAQAGYVYDGYMIGVRPVNCKLRNRAIRIVSALTGLDAEGAAQLLDTASGHIPVAVLMHRLDLAANEAASGLAEAGGDLRAALGETASPCETSPGFF